MEEVERVGRKCRTNTVSGSFWTEVPDEYCIRKFLDGSAGRILYQEVFTSF